MTSPRTSLHQHFVLCNTCRSLINQVTVGIACTYARIISPSPNPNALSLCKLPLKITISFSTKSISLSDRSLKLR